MTLLQFDACPVEPFNLHEIPLLEAEFWLCILAMSWPDLLCLHAIPHFLTCQVIE
ncbi:hypothetical protein GCM10008938_49030 [Deinococcus roseus]|uniref:Uncharacterized protein n=1 Tax=Deinococcus roseus TaxID=392414 RepID=A0ABQ2DH60_9DEIO|nr:hypothetical protein GCM10008938_49030 [Deinococcus roseus]